MSWEIRQGDALERLREMPDESVQTVVTSPPYFGLRDYGTAEWEGGGSECDHMRQSPTSRRSSGLGPTNPETGRAYDSSAFTQGGAAAFGKTCGKCGARRIDSQLGLEPTPEEYVANLVEVFREVRRVLRSDGTVWCNLGDSYASQGGHTDQGSTSQRQGRSNVDEQNRGSYSTVAPGLKQKDLVGIPWRVAFALQADGWWLRSDIIWSKPNPMPESVTDRPTRAHEYLFLLTKSARYFMDMDAVREPHAELERPQSEGRRLQRMGRDVAGVNGLGQSSKGIDGGAVEASHTMQTNPAGRNRRSVWEIATAPFPDAHFAVFPPKLVEPCILAGSPPKCCGECGAPWERVVERGEQVSSGPNALATKPRSQDRHVGDEPLEERPVDGWGDLPRWDTQTLGWRPSCDHRVGPGWYEPEPGAAFADIDTGGGGGPSVPSGRSIVLDPFAGSGTTGVVALRHDRSFIGIELSSDYCELARNRIRDDAPLLNTQLEAA